MGGVLTKSSNPFATMEGPDEMFLRGHTDSVFAVAHSPDGKRVASAGADRAILIWDINRGKLRRTLLGHTAAVNALQYSPTGTILVSAGDDRMIFIWNPKKGVKTTELAADRLKYSQIGPINALAFNDDGKCLASAHGSPRDSDNSIRVWDIKKAEEIMRPLTGHGSLVTSVAYCDDFIASGSFDGMIKIWNARNGELKHSLRSQTGIIMCVAFSPDGMYVAAGEGCSNNANLRPSILRWETNRGVPVGMPMQGHTASIRSIAYSPDGTMLISGAEDGTVRTWRPNARKYVGMVTGHVAVVSSVAISPDQLFISSGSEDRTARLISLAYTPKARFFKKEKCMLCGCSRKDHHEERLSCLSYMTPHVIPDHYFSIETEGEDVDQDSHPDSAKEQIEQLNSPFLNSDVIEGEGNQSNTMKENSPVLEADAQPPKLPENIEQVKIPPTMNKLVSFRGSFRGSEADVSDAGSITTVKSSRVSTIPARKNVVNSRRRSRKSRDDIYEIGSVEDDKISVSSHTKARHRQRNGSKRNSLDGSQTSASEQLALTPKQVVLEDVALGMEDGDSDNCKTFKCNQQLLSVAHNPDGRTIVTGASDGSILLWDIVKGKQRGAQFAGHSDAVLCLAYHPRGDIIASGSADETAILWDSRTGRQLREPFLGHSDRVWSVAFSPDGNTLITGGGDAMIILWETRTGQPKGYPLEGHTDWIGRAVFSPDGATIASGGGDKTVRLWDTASGEQKMELTSHTDFVYTLAYSPDGSLLATGSRDKSICMWNPTRGNFVMPPLLGHLEAVLSIIFLKNSTGLFLVSGSYDCTVNIWNTEDGSLVHSFKGHRKAVVSVCCAPDGTAVASASLDTTMKFWNLMNLMDIAATSVADGTDDNTIRDDISFTDFGSEDDLYSETDMDGTEYSDNASVARLEMEEIGAGKHRNALRIGGIVGIAVQRFAKAGNELAKRRQSELIGNRVRTPSLYSVAESSNEGLETGAEKPAAAEDTNAPDMNEIRTSARQKVKAGLLAIKAGQRVIAFAKEGKAEINGLGGTQSPRPTQSEPVNSKEEENRKAAVMWFTCSLQAAAANDLLPASQLAEVGIALCETDQTAFGRELLSLKELQSTLRRASSRSRDPLEWSAEDVVDFLRLSSGNLGIDLSEPIDGQRLVQSASEFLAVWTGLKDAMLLKHIKTQLTGLVQMAAESQSDLPQDGNVRLNGSSVRDIGPDYDAGGPNGDQRSEVSYEVILGSSTFEIFPEDPAAPKLGTLSDIKRAIVEHIGDPDILGPNDDFRLVRLDTQSGRDMAMGQNTRAVELMIIQGRRPVFKVLDVKPK